MAKTPAKTKRGTQPLKLALAIVLAVVFVIVMVVQFGGSAREGAGPQGDAGNNQSRTSGPGRLAQAVPESKKIVTAPYPTPGWPIQKRADVLEFDPFAVSEAFCSRKESAAKALKDEAAAAQREKRRKRQAEQDQMLAKLRQEGVQAVIGTSSGSHAAVVGSQTVRVGDVLGGFRVIAIEPTGVVLERPAIE